MQERESKFITFVVEIWLEQTAEETTGGSWRGRIANTLEERKHYVQSLEDISAYVSERLRRLGVEP